MLGELELLREDVPVTLTLGEEVVCDEYSGQYLGTDALVYMDEDGLPVLRVVTFDLGSFRISLHDTTLRGEAPSYESVTVDRDIGPGDFMFFYGDLESADDVPMMMTVQDVSDDGMVLMTHAPSYGILDQIPSGQSVGSPAIREIVDRYHPILAMSGHIHEAIGVVETDGTVFVNPGPAKDGRMAIVDITDGKVSVELIGPTDH